VISGTSLEGKEFFNTGIPVNFENYPMKYPQALLSLITYLKKLPGVGSKTAERFAFQLLSWPESQLSELAMRIKEIKEKIKHCPECHCLMENKCDFCHESVRDQQLLCVISCAKDALIIEETRSYRGLYHVIDGLLSPLEGRTPEKLQLDRLKKRIQTKEIKEIIIALDSTIEGDATALYLKEELKGVRISRLAFGLPMGSTLDFVDEGTLAHALLGRHVF
jgi:recombination protein RecR